MTSAKIEVRREKVKQLMLKGLNYKEIMEQMIISSRTIVSDVKSIREDIMKEIKTDTLDTTVSRYIQVADELIKELMTNAQKRKFSISAKNWVKNLLKERIEILQSLGLLPYKPSISITEVTNYAVQWINSTEDTIQTTELAARVPQEQ